MERGKKLTETIAIHCNQTNSAVHMNVNESYVCTELLKVWSQGEEGELGNEHFFDFVREILLILLGYPRRSLKFMVSVF